MKATNHPNSAARVNPYSGRSHTKKLQKDQEWKQSLISKKAKSKKCSAIKTDVSNSMNTHYRHCGKPIQPYENNPSQKFNLKARALTDNSSNIKGAKVSPARRRDPEGASTIAVKAEAVFANSLSSLNPAPCPSF